MQANSDILLEINIQDIPIKKENIERLLGYDESDQEPMVSEIIEKYLEKLPEMIDPMAGYVIKHITDINPKMGILEVEGKTFTIKRIIASQLKGADHIAAFICTIGNNLEKQSRELMDRGEALEGYILDLIGSEAAEGIAGYLHKNVEQLSLFNRLQVTNRFSPGYCGWDVKEQTLLFDLFENPCCGITLNSSSLMNPIKSVSGIIGIGPSVKFAPYSCSKCDDEHCIYRNRK
ncbi:MAG: hypothetical protein JXB49_36340 [Bacteroidales bacterium]|nr:hypothetical protein [Bacteroidales bacterium]